VSANGDPKRNVILEGDARERLGDLPAASVDCVVTSPPYFLLRDYGVDGQIGLEAEVEAWVSELRLVMAGVARVLKPTGTAWLNLGDTYSRHMKYGAPPKSLLLGPERVALALLQDGWIVRNKIIWAKTNPMPSSVKDRLSCGWEVIYLLVRQQRYHLELDTIRMPPRSKGGGKPRSTIGGPIEGSGRPSWAGPLAGSNVGLKQMKALGLVSHPLGKNPGDLWRLPAANFKGRHFATFPPVLVRRALLAGCPERTCVSCGEPWTRASARQIGRLAVRGELAPSCACKRDWRPGLVIDPFLGAGTVGVVAKELGRDWLGIELNPSFARMAATRIGATEAASAAGRTSKAA